MDQLKSSASTTGKSYGQVSAFVLTGGASSRMGAPKGLLEFDGCPLIVRIARIVGPLVSSVMLVGATERYASLGLRIIEDGKFGEPTEDRRNPGPLAGIASALVAAETEWNLILACDLPYLTSQWLDWLLARAVISSAEVIMPRTADGPEPLACVYRRECAQPVIDALERGVRKVTDAMEQFKVEYVAEKEWRHVDPDGRVLLNMNVPEDYEEARKWLEARSQ